MRSWLAGIVAEDARSAKSSNCSPMRFSASPRAQLNRPTQICRKVDLHAPVLTRVLLEHFSIRLGVSRVCEISFAFSFGNPFEKRGDCSPKLLNGTRLHFA